MGEENHVIRSNEDVFARIVHHAAQQHPDVLAVPLQRHVGFDRLELRAAGARNQRQQPLADAVESQHTGRVHVA